MKQVKATFFLSLRDDDGRDLSREIGDVAEDNAMIHPTRLSPAEQKIRQQAVEMLSDGTDAETFSSRFFGSRGELSRLGRDREERRRILDSEFYHWLKAEYSRLRQEGARQFEQDLETGPGRLTL